MGKDKRGTERLHCADCDCEEYEQPMNGGHDCGFCGCKPTKHKRAIPEDKNQNSPKKPRLDAEDNCGHEEVSYLNEEPAPELLGAVCHADVCAVEPEDMHVKPYSHQQPLNSGENSHRPIDSENGTDKLLADASDGSFQTPDIIGEYLTGLSSCHPYKTLIQGTNKGLA